MEYENALKKLQHIVDKLSGSDITLAESLKLYEDGVAVSKTCLDELKDYSGRITQITNSTEQLFDTEYAED